MERLTHYLADGKTAAEPKNRAEGLAFAAKLAAYEDAEENGTLVRLPCKVGDTVYIISKVTNPKFSKNGNGIINGVTSETKLEIHKKPFYYDLLSFMGDLCFLTREEAEKALKERESE